MLLQLLVLTFYFCLYLFITFIFIVFTLSVATATVSVDTMELGQRSCFIVTHHCKMFAQRVATASVIVDAIILCLHINNQHFLTCLH